MQWVREYVYDVKQHESDRDFVFRFPPPADLQAAASSPAGSPPPLLALAAVGSWTGQPRAGFVTAETGAKLLCGCRWQCRQGPAVSTFLLSQSA